MISNSACPWEILIYSAVRYYGLSLHCTFKTYLLSKKGCEIYHNPPKNFKTFPLDSKGLRLFKFWPATCKLQITPSVTSLKNHNCNLFQSSLSVSNASVPHYSAVKKYLSSRLTMNTRRLWNSHKFLSAEMAFPGVFFRGIFHRGCYVVWSEYTQDWEQCRQNVSGVPGHHTVRTFHRSKPLNMHSMSFKTGKRMLYNFFRWRLFSVSSCGRRDESTRRFWSATGPYVVFYYVFHEYAKYTCV